MATELGKAYVQVIPSAKGFKGAITKELSGESASAGKAAGEAVGSNLISTLKKLIVAAGIGKIITESLNLGGELQQNLGGSEAVFGDYANNLQKIAADAYKNMGLSQSDYLAAANKMGSLLQGSGIDQAKAMDLTTSAMQRAADVASVMGLDTVSAMEAIAGAAKGNFTMMDNLGVAMNATTLQAYALEKGLNFDWNVATNAEKNELALKMFMDRTTQYADNFARESEETFSGSMGAMKAAFTNLLANLSLGNDIGQSLQDLSSTVLTFLTKNLIPMIGNILKQVPTIISFALNEGVPQLLTAFTSLFQGLPETLNNLLPQLVSFGQNIVDNIKNGIIANIPTLLAQGLPMLLSFTENLRANFGKLVDMGLDLIVSFVNGLIAGLPTLIEFVPQIITNIAGLINDNMPKIFQKGLDIIVSLAKGIWNNLPVIVANMGNILKAVISVIQAINWLSLGSKILTGIINGIKNMGPSLVSGMKSLAQNGLQAFKNIDWLGLGRNIINGIISGLKNAGGAMLDYLLSLAKSALNGVKKFFGISSPSKVMANQVGKWIPAGIAEGIKDNMRPLDNAMNDLVSDTVLEANAGINDALNSSNVSVDGINNDGTLGAKLDAMIYLMQEYYPDMAKGIDGKELVSGIDRALGLAVV